MGKRILAVLITLAFAAPAALAGASSARLRDVSGSVANMLATGNAAASTWQTGLTRDSGQRADWLQAASLSALRREPAVARLLARVDLALESVKQQENALAVLLEADKPDDVRDREERLTRRAKTPHEVREG